MIVFDLRCGAAGHVFEAWFGSSSDFEAQQARGLVQCPLCGDPDVTKAVMAPRLGSGVSQPGLATSQSGEADGNMAMKSMLAHAALAQRKLLANSENVGSKFAAEARAIHLGEADARSIHGQATRDEVTRLRDEGVPVAPLPFPVVAANHEN